MFNENVVLCASSAYEKKFYLNEAFDKLPEDIKNELKIMCVLFTEEVGGILTLEFDENGTLLFKTEADENDLLYDGRLLPRQRLRLLRPRLLRRLPWRAANPLRRPCPATSWT